MVVKSDTASQPFKYSHPIRCHGQKFRINILYKDKRYIKIKNKDNLIYVDGNTVKLFNNSILIFSNQSFYGDTTEQSFSKSMGYWDRFFHIVENDTQTILVKPRKQNIKMYDFHFAEINNELAEECEKKGYKIRVFATDTGKLWFTIDNSLNQHEAETQGETALEDMRDVVSKVMNEYRDKKAPLPEEMWKIISVMAKHEVQLGAGLNSIVKLLQPNEPKETKDKKIPDYFG